MLDKKISGVEEVKDIFRMSLDNKEKTLRTVLSSKPLVYLCGEEFAQWYMKERSDKNIHLKSLRITSDDIDQPEHKNYEAIDKEVRYNTLLNHKSSLVLWDDYVTVINPDKASGFLIQDEGYAELTKDWFEYVWIRSQNSSIEPIEIAKRYFELSNERDLDGIAEILADSATYSSENTGMHFGKKNILVMTKTFFESFTELHWEVHEITEEKPGAILFDFTLTGTKNDGEKISRDGLEYVVVHEGKVQHVEVRNK